MFAYVAALIGAITENSIQLTYTEFFTNYLDCYLLFHHVTGIIQYIIHMFIVADCCCVCVSVGSFSVIWFVVCHTHALWLNCLVDLDVISRTGVLVGTNETLCYIGFLPFRGKVICGSNCVSGNMQNFGSWCCYLAIFIPFPCPPTDSIITLMTVWRITGKIIRTTIMLITYARV